MNNRNIPVLVGGDFNLDLRNFPAINEYPGNSKRLQFNCYRNILPTPSTNKMPSL